MVQEMSVRNMFWAQYFSFHHWPEISAGLHPVGFLVMGRFQKLRTYVTWKPKVKTFQLIMVNILKSRIRCAYIRVKIVSETRNKGKNPSHCNNI